MRSRRRWRILSNELAIGNFARRPLLRNDAGNRSHRSCASRVDMGRMIVGHSSVRSEAAPFLRSQPRPSQPPRAASSRAAEWPARSSFTLYDREHDGVLVFFWNSRLHDHGGLLFIAHAANELNRILSRHFAFLSVGSREPRKNDPRKAREKRSPRPVACG